MPHGREQGRAVLPVGRADVDDIHVGILGDGTVVGGGHVRAHGLPGLLGRLRATGDDVRDPGAQRQGVLAQRDVLRRDA